MKKYLDLNSSVTCQLGKLHHQHLIIKAFVRNPPKTSEVIENWLRELVSSIDMKIVMGPFSKYVDSCGNAGITAAVVIETSHCAIHVWDEPNPAMIQMDVYSCSAFTSEAVLKKLEEFGIIAYELMMIDRNEDFKVTESKHQAP
jgi:S-adenosylmethionine/arginine decarboxylase-like enzyme